jgi:hypothetical protein
MPVIEHSECFLLVLRDAEAEGFIFVVANADLESIDAL